MSIIKIRTLFYTLLLGLGFSQAIPAVAAHSAETRPEDKTGIKLKDVADGVYTPGYIYGVHPLNDGDSYSQLSDDGKRIVRSSFKTGKEVGVVFDVEKARGTTKLSRIDGYIMSPDEQKILLRTQTKAVYRRTSTAVYYIYDVANGKFTPLSDGGPQMSPRFSPDGNVVAFVRDNNLFVVKLLYGNAETQVTNHQWYPRLGE